MIGEIVTNPIFDLLLLILIIRFILPGLFIIRPANRKEKDRIIIRENKSEQSRSSQPGEYIDYEEVK